MKKVLIVDDDQSFRQSLIDGFKSYEDKFAIATAEDGVQACEILEKDSINLVLTDLKMPRMDGFELVAHLSSNFTDIPVIVMTAFGTPEMEDNLREMGTFQYIEKPIDFTLLVEKILKGLEGPSQGYITGVSLSSFLQLLELDKKDCTLTINAGSKSGTMFFRDGELLDAQHGAIRGSEAAYIIVSWKNVEISIDNKCPVTEKRIQESLGFILLEGSRRKDENDAASQLNMPPASESFGSLDSLNMADLDLDLTTEKNLAPTPPTSRQPLAPSQSQEVANNPILAQFITMLSSFPEINGATVSSKNGTVLHQSGDSNANVANFITYVAVAAEQIEIAIGSSGRQYSIFAIADGSKLIVLCGSDVVVGLRVGNSVIPGPIADGLRPILSRITLRG
jgi:CheY-like chemotaxis protein